MGLAGDAASATAAPRGALWRAATQLASFAGLRGATAAASPPAVTYLPLHESVDCTIGIFCLPAGGVIPLHNHPDMVVLSRLLYGDMDVRSLDAPEARGGAATLASAGVWSATAGGGTRVLRPGQGNVHAFRAVTACAVLDVLGPPYDARAGRPCTYFAEAPAASAQQPGWLTPVPPPRDVVIARAPYTGTPLRVPRA